ncbi:hypothetical protein M2404_002894 [Rheinheimera pacifica]|nr:hypothetical protein [Rheinheimera pacifica]
MQLQYIGQHEKQAQITCYYLFSCLINIGLFYFLPCLKVQVLNAGP